MLLSSAPSENDVGSEDSKNSALELFIANGRGIKKRRSSDQIYDFLLVEYKLRANWKVFSFSFYLLRYVCQYSLIFY